MDGNLTYTKKNVGRKLCYNGVVKNVFVHSKLKLAHFSEDTVNVNDLEYNTYTIQLIS